MRFYCEWVGVFFLFLSFPIRAMTIITSNTPMSSSSQQQQQQQQQLLSLLQTTLSQPSIDSIEIIETIEQASAVGYIVRAHYSSSNQRNEQQQHEDDKHEDSYHYYFIKRVEAARYMTTKSDWADLRRALLYARTEARFYRTFAPRLLQQGSKAWLPHVYAANYNLSEWIPDEEDGFQPANEEMTQLYPNLPNPQNIGGTLILEYLDSQHFFQDSPLTLTQCHASLRAIAQMHASAWEDVALLRDAEKQLSRSSFHLSMRNPKEIQGIVQAWDHFANEFASELQWSGTHLGERVQVVAQYVSDQLSVTPESPFATLCHGDYKSMNVFLPLDTTKSAVLVDFASVGIGLGITDVSMHIHHCLVPEDLEQNEEALVRYYWQVVQDHLVDPNHRATYTWDVAWRQYQLAVVDYFRFFLGRFWKSSTHSSMNKLKNNKNTNLINRSVPAAMAFVKRVDQYLDIVEAEYVALQQQQQQQQQNTKNEL